MAENTFILNRYLKRQFETGSSCKSTATANQQQQADYDLNANEFNQINSELLYKQNELLKEKDHETQVYYDEPLWTPSLLDEVNRSLNLFCETVYSESPSRSSFAKLPNCLRRKQQYICKSKYVERQQDTKLTAVYKNGRNIDKNYPPNVLTEKEPVINHCFYNMSFIDSVSSHNKCCPNGVPINSVLFESTPSPKRIYDRFKRNHIRHIVKTTREKINQSLFSFKRSGKSRNECNEEKNPKKGIFFNNSYSDSNLHLSVQQTIEEKSSHKFEHFIMNCNGAPKQPHQQPLSKLSRFSSVDNLFDGEFRDFGLANYENELNHAKKSFLKTNILRRQRPVNSSREDRMKWWQRTNAKSSTTSSSSKSKDSNSEGEYSIDHSVLSPAHTNSTSDDCRLEEISAQFKKADDSSGACTPHDVPDWNELCNRIYRFRIKPFNQTLPWNALESNSKSTPPSLLLQPEKSSNTLNSTLETITQSCRQELFNQTSPSIINGTSSQSKCDTAQTGSLLLLDSGTTPVKTKIQFDVKVFIERVAKRIYAFKKTSSNRESLEKSIENIELSQIDDDDDGDRLYQLNQQPSIRAYKTFLLDLCKEQSKGTFCTDANCPMPHFSLMLPNQCQKRPWPLTEDLFVQALQKRVESLLELPKTDAQQGSLTTRSAQHFTDQRKCAQEVKRFGLMAYCRMQRKMDFVDSVLYQEMVEDEHQWSLQST